MDMIDNITRFISDGMDYTDRRMQIMRCQSTLSDLTKQKTQMLANLGQRILRDEQNNQDFIQRYVNEITAISNVERREIETRKQLEGLQQLVTVVPQQQSLQCVGCGAMVIANARFCPQCGENLDLTRAQYRRCPQCGTYYGADTSFCERCGVRVVVPAPTASPQVMSYTGEVTSDSATASDGIGTVISPEDSVGGAADTQQTATPEPAQPTGCPQCGMPTKPGAAYCGECGASLA